MEIRPLRPEDRVAWEPLWRGYLEFYETELPPAQYDLTWKRLMDPAELMYALGAFEYGKLIGITHYILNRSCWLETYGCYLQDLFTHKDHRGKGVGTALIRAVREETIKLGAHSLWWMTQESNATARRVYDQLATNTGTAIYKMDLK